MLIYKLFPIVVFLGCPIQLIVELVDEFEGNVPYLFLITLHILVKAFLFFSFIVFSLEEKLHK
jgi:hypothetical protein